MASQGNNSSPNNANVSSGNGINRTPAQAIEPSVSASRNGLGGTSRFGRFALAPGVGNTLAGLPGSSPVAPTTAPPTVDLGSNLLPGVRGRFTRRGRGNIRGRGSSRGRGNSGRGSYGGISRANVQPSITLRPNFISIDAPLRRPAAAISAPRSITLCLADQDFWRRATQFMIESGDSEFFIYYHTAPERARARARQMQLERELMYAEEEMARRRNAN